MDNNMIHIDDLVRQRLRGGEEPDRPGAWLTMRELLDKEMPVSSGYNWRRIAGYFTALLLLIAASVGGYKLYNSHVASSGVSAGGGGREGEGQYSATGAEAVSSATINNNTQSGTGTVASDIHSTTSNRNSVSVNKNTTSLSEPSNAGASHSRNNAGNRRSSAVASHESDVHAASDSRKSNHAAALKQRSGEKDNTEADKAQQPEARDAVPALAINSAAQSVQKASPQKAAQRQPVPGVYAGTASTTVHANRTLANASRSRGADVRMIQPVPGGAQPISKLPKPEVRTTVKHDSMERLEIVYRRLYDAGNERYYYRVDTLPMGKFARNIAIAAGQDDKVGANTAGGKSRKRGLFRHRPRSTDVAAIASNNGAASGASDIKNDVADKTNFAPNGTLSTKADESAKSGANALNASSANTKHFQLLDMAKVQEAINRVKSDIASIEMYPGIMAGINASLLTPNALGGFQLGLTSLFVLNDWWSLMLEPKYIIRFNTGSSLRDDYKQVIDNSGSIVPDPQMPGYYVYTWTDKTIQHNFNYDIIKTFELPIMARYHWGQKYLQGGPNLVFSSPINTKEVTQELNDYKVHGESRPGPPGTFITNDHPNVQSSDFGNRFGIGYVISGGFMFSPTVYVDARITQTVWDNSKTDGAKQVSKDLLRSPSFQISVGYRFGKH